MDLMMIFKFILELNTLMVPFKSTLLFFYNAYQQCYESDTTFIQLTIQLVLQTCMYAYIYAIEKLASTN